MVFPWHSGYRAQSSKAIPRVSRSSAVPSSRNRFNLKVPMTGQDQIRQSASQTDQKRPRRERALWHHARVLIPGIAGDADQRIDVAPLAQFLTAAFPVPSQRCAAACMHFLPLLPLLAETALPGDRCCSSAVLAILRDWWRLSVVFGCCFQRL